jgi:hypothetical protein
LATVAATTGNDDLREVEGLYAGQMHYFKVLFCSKNALGIDLNLSLRILHTGFGPTTGKIMEAGSPSLATIVSSSYPDSLQACLAGL